MSERFSGGIISKTPVTPSGPYQTDTASGVWTLDQQAYWAKLGQWPTAGNMPKDAQFNYVTMLLHGDGTNGAQNNTFLDSSTNNFTITRNGNTTQGSFSPYGSNWSNYFDGSGYLTTSNTSALKVGTGDFTVEFWSYWIDQGTGSFYAVTSMGSNSLNIQNQFGTFNVQFEGISNVINFSLTPYYNSWNHFAVVRQSGTTKVYVNGSVVATASDTNDYQGSGPLNIGLRTGGGYLNSYISNFRVCKSAVYTSTFTPSTAPLTTTSQGASNCTILMCQSNRFIDNSASALVFTVGAGTPSVQRFNPFGASTAYSTSVIGGSGYFSDSSGTQMLYLPSNTAFNLDANFTIEGWVYKFNTTSKIFLGSDYNNGNSPTINNQIQFDRSGTAGLTGMYHPSTGWLTVTCSSSPNSAWFHLAYVRSGSTVTIYLNGVSQGTISTSETYQFSGGAVGGLRNYSETSGGGWYGYMSNFRIVKGTAVYTSNFTPPTAPLTSVSGTSVLLNMTNGAIFDNAMMNDLETVGNAQISTSVKKYGTGSLAFDGTGDWLIMPYGPTQNFSTGSFTIEMWAYLNSLAASYYVPAGTWGSGTSDEWLIQIRNDGYIRFLTTAGSTFYSASITTATWYHIAIVRNGSTINIYINGTSVGSYTCTNSLGSTAKTLYIGTQAGTWDWNGYIDDFRITNGYARYTANFTPPTAAFPDIGPT